MSPGVSLVEGPPRAEKVDPGRESSFEAELHGAFVCDVMAGGLTSDDEPRLAYYLYKSHAAGVTSVTLSQFRSRQSEYIAAAQREPVEITSRGVGRRAVVVSPEFFDRAMQALEDQDDIRSAAAARDETGRVSHQDLMRELGL